MPAWQPNGGGSGGSVDFKDTSGGGGSAPIYHPTASGGGTGEAGGVDPNASPGVISVNPLDPAGTIAGAGKSTGNFIDDLSKGIFGVTLADGSHSGGMPIGAQIGGALSAIPGVNVAVGTAGDILGGAGDTLSNAANIVGGALEHISTPGGSPALDARFNTPEVQAWLDEKANADDPTSLTNRERLATEVKDGKGNYDKGILGTGLFGSEAHMKNVVLREFDKAQAIKNPTFNPGAFQPPESLADVFTFLVADAFSVASQAYQTGIARLHDRAGEAEKLASGEYASTGFLGTGAFAGDAGATSVEKLAAEKMQDGSWSSDQATDFLVSQGQTAHDARLSIALAVASPDVAAGFGMGLAARLGTKGAQLFKSVGIADKAITAAEDGLRVAQAAKVAAKAGGAVGKELRAASKVIRTAQKDLAEAKAARETLTAGRMADTTLAFGEKYAGLSKLNEAGVLERTTLGKVAKYTRTLIDPMHAIGGGMPGKERLVDLASDDATKVLSATLNDFEYQKNFEHFRGLDATGTLVDKYARDLATAAANRVRSGLLQMHQISNVKKIGKAIAGALGPTRDEVIANAEKSVQQRSLNKWLREDYTKNVLQHNWSEAAHKDLAKGLEAHYGVPADEWMKVLPGMSKEQKSLMKFAVYGGSNSRLLAAISATKAVMHASLAKWDPDGIILIARDTLTRQGGDSLLSQLKRLKTRSAVKLIREWQARYPELRYIAVDPANPGKSVQQMMDYLDKNIQRLPMQVERAELKQMHTSMQELSASLGDGYQLGFRPKDEFLWGIERGNAAGGDYIVRRAPWADHVGEGGLGFRPGRNIPLNIAGMPIIGTTVKTVGKAVDYMSAGARMLGAQVSGEQVHAMARGRFVSEASRGKFAAHGLTEDVAGRWFDRLNEYVREEQGYSGPRGLGKGNLWNALDKERLIPTTILNGSMRITPEDILLMTLDAYDGDIRYIGLTQKLSARAKRVLSMNGANNFAGQISEHAWPLMKFRYNPLFQLQEKIEPVVLNAQRGVSFAITPRMTAADQRTERLLQIMTDNSIVRQADIDMFEQSMLAMFGKRMDNLAKTPGSKMSALSGAASSFMDVQGLKRINMVRTFRHGLAKEMKGAYPPGVWDDLYAHANAKAGRMLSEDEFAVQVITENLLGNDIKITKTFAEGGKDILKADWSNAIKPGAWHVGAHFGQLQGLDIGHIAKTMNTRGVDGKRIENLADLRAYIAEDHSRISEVREYLNRMGAHKDYIARVENSLTFSWEGLWTEAAKRYSLTTRESMALQDLVAASAELRGMNPVDFLSQVYSPGIIDGTEGIIGSLDRPLGVLRRNAAGAVTGRGRSVLAGTAGVTNKEDLVRQLSAVFSAHLDPSAKRALLMEFSPELKAAVDNGTLRLDLEDVQKMWNKGAEDQLADRILNYMDGRPGTGSHAVLKDATRGDANLRAGADRYLRNHGVEPLGERRNYAIDSPEAQAHYQQTADDFGAIPEVPYDKTGRRPTTKQLYAADSDLKPRPEGVDQRDYDAYQQFVHENRAQFDHMTTPKAQGGMGIKVIVAKADPYTPDSAGRAAMQADLKKGQLRVKGTDSDHPLMTNEQNVMFRAVHDVFGHGAEGFSFGPRGELNAAAAHFRMYGPEARGPMLTETHGQTAYVNFSDDIIPGNTPRVPLDTADPVGDFESRHPWTSPSDNWVGADLGPDFPAAQAGEHQFVVHGLDAAGDPVSTELTATSTVGDGLRNVGDGPEFYYTPKEVHNLLDAQDAVDSIFPDFPQLHVDAPVNFHEPPHAGGLGQTEDVHGFTIDAYEPGTGIIMYSPTTVQLSASEKGLARLKSHWEHGKTLDEFTIDGKTWARKSMPKTPFNAGYDIRSTAAHEKMHVIDEVMNEDPLSYPAYHDFVAVYKDSVARRYVSEYGMIDDHEMMSELGTLAFDPRVDVTKLHPEVQQAIKELKDVLRKLDVLKDAPPVEHAGMTVRAANAAKRGSYYAPQKAGVLPQKTIDSFAEQFVGVGKHVESNPDVARTAQMFGKFSENAIFNGLMRGDQSVHGDLLKRIGAIPKDDAVPYNLTESMTNQIATDAMKRKFDDAFRLQYFSQDRSMLERSINHPMFGLYPASYMWGKLLPEVGQFLAKRPFGIRTGGALSAGMHAQASIALRREFDPAFDAQIEKMGHSQAMSFLGYLLPTLPWDVSASAPQWMKDIAAQGARNEANAAAFKPIEDFNIVQPVVDTFAKLDPITQNVAWAGRAVDELNGPNTPEEKRQALLAAAQGGIKGANISPLMSDILAELQAALSR